MTPLRTPSARVARAALALLVGTIASAATPTFEAALAAKRTGEHARAIALFQELAAAEPNNAEVLFHLGTVQGWAGRYDDALATFARARTLAPTDADIQLGYGRVLAWSGQLAPAEKIFRAILEHSPDNLEARNMLGRVLLWQRRLDAASAVFTNILTSAPSNTDALVGQGDVERFQERFAEARQLYERALAVEPDSADLQQRLASVRGAGRWRLDVGFEYSDFAGEARDVWQGWDGALRYTVDRRTGVSLGYERARRFNFTDAQYSLGLDRRFNDRLSGYARASLTPDADFFAGRSLAVGGIWRARAAAGRWGPTLLLADYRAASFEPGTAQSLWIGATQYLNARLAVTAKGLLTRNLNHDTTTGWQLRLDGEPSDEWRWALGYADAHESMSSTVFDFTRELRTRTVFANVSHWFSSTFGLRLDLTREETENVPERHALHVGVTTRF
jgi:YaiO family outer membrane protein